MEVMTTIDGGDGHTQWPMTSIAVGAVYAGLVDTLQVVVHSNSSSNSRCMMALTVALVYWGGCAVDNGLSDITVAAVSQLRVSQVHQCV